MTQASLWNALFWTYLADLTLLVVHEIDSAYWKEWELFHLPGASRIPYHPPGAAAAAVLRPCAGECP